MEARGATTNGHLLASFGVESGQTVAMNSTEPVTESKGASIASTCINLCKNMIGAGLLNVCIAFKYSSVLGGLLAMLFSTFVSTAGFLLIGFCCDKYGATTFRELWRKAVGPQTEKTVDVVLFFHTLFSCVGYITLIGDFSTKSASGLLPGSKFEDRGFAVAVIVILAIFPLSLLKNLHSLKFTSALGLAITTLACLYVFCDAVAQIDLVMGTLAEKWWYMKLEIFKTIALFNGSFSAHYNAPNFYAELKDRSFKRFAQCALISFAIGTFLYTVFGLAGYGRFGDEVLGNILKGYNEESTLVQLCWLSMGLSTVFVYPHAFQRMRASFCAIIGKEETDIFIPTTVGLLLLCVYGGIKFTDIAVIKMIKGATLGTSLMFIFPAMFYIILSNQGPSIIKVKFSENACLMRALSTLLLLNGLGCGIIAVLVHCKII